MSEREIGDRLVEHGEALLHAEKQHLIPFTKDDKADELLNDLTNHPHAFVLACLMDRQYEAEKAWIVPYRISERLGGFSIVQLAELSLDDVTKLMNDPAPLHRFANRMSDSIYRGVQRIVREYDGDAARIWRGRLSSAAVVYRFLEFHGAGPKIATMATNILARDFKIEFSDHFSIDISADAHVQRVFQRLQLTSEKASLEQIIYKARALSPGFPGLLDLPCWEIGRTWCRPTNRNCAACYMNDLCPSTISS